MREVTSELMEETGGTLLTLYEDGHAVACVEYIWIKDYQDMKRVDRGARPLGGEVLYLANIATSQPHQDHLSTLKPYLPMARYIVGLRVHAPKGVPHDFYASTAVPVSI